MSSEMSDGSGLADRTNSVDSVFAIQSDGGSGRHIVPAPGTDVHYNCRRDGRPDQSGTKTSTEKELIRLGISAAPRAI